MKKKRSRKRIHELFHHAKMIREKRKRAELNKAEIKRNRR